MRHSKRKIYVDWANSVAASKRKNQFPIVKYKTLSSTSRDLISQTSHTLKRRHIKLFVMPKLVIMRQQSNGMKEVMKTDRN